MHIPISTYRLQLNSSFGFKAAKDIVPYLNSLGISDIYASPILKARKGSTHGYDVVDPNQINPELGREEEFEELIVDLKEKGMFWLQDIVPNHMAYDKQNLMLMDIFEQRDNSPFFHYFDIDWVHPFESFQGRVLAPFLGGFYSETLENKEIKIVFNENGLSVKYYDLQFPLFLSTYKDVFLHSINALENKIGKGSSLLIKFLGIVDIFERISKTQDGQQYNQVRHAKNMLWQLYNENGEIKSFVDKNIAYLNGENENAHAIEDMDKILSEQCYRLSFWKVASEELNYRRFFTINELISLRVEKKDVFDYTHKLILQMIREGKIHGLRIDHIDGLYDPIKYLDNLRNQAKETYIVVEKILSLREQLPASLPIQGTTGYDFMNYLNRLFCLKDNDAQLTKIYFRFTNIIQPYEKIVQDKKRLIIGKHMAGDIDNLAHIMKKVAGHHRFGRDITLYGLKRALVEIVTFFPVYRTYINYDNFDSQDKDYINEAIEKAHTKAPALEYEVDFIRKFLSLELLENLVGEEKNEFWQIIMKFQQLTAPIMAKGFEDTVFYTYNKLISLNEVGGEPALLSVEPQEFFKFLKKRSAQTPHSLNATATHDTKRGEDVRARINVLSEIPDDWKTYLAKWATLNKAKKQKNGDEYIPSANDEYFIYQTLLGSFPFEGNALHIYSQRIKDYLIKAVREAKEHTAWIKPDAKYEEACLSFVDKLLDCEKGNLFLQGFQELHQKVSNYGIYNSLSQVLIKMTAPGVPDFYQGTELWDLNLVDPDNRRQVDYNTRRNYLQYIQGKIPQDIIGLMDELLKNKTDGRIKLFLIHQSLQFRRKHEDLFLKGGFLPLEIEGEHSKSVVAYARILEDKWAVTVAPRFLTRIIKETEFPLGKEIWKDTYIQLPESISGALANAITLQNIQYKNKIFLGDVLTHFPVALLQNLGVG